MPSPVNNPALPATLPSWVKVTVPYTSLQTAGLTNTVLVFSLPVKGVIHAAKLLVNTLFSGSAIASIVATLGVAGTVAKFVASATIAGTGLTDGVGLAVPDCESTSGATSVNLYVTAVGANLSALTQGSLDVYLLVSTLP